MLSLALAANLIQTPAPSIEPFSFYGMRTFADQPNFRYNAEKWILVMAPANYEDLTFHLIRDGQEVRTAKHYFEELQWPAFRPARLQGPPEDITQPGSYVAEFRLGGQTISKFPFTLEKAAGNDPYNPTANWSFITPIDRMGQLHADPERDSPVYLSFLMHADREGFARRDPWQAKLFLNGTQIGESTQLVIDYTHNKPYTARFVVTGANGRKDELNYSDMMKLNGTLRMDIHVKDKKVRSFTYNISGGAIKPHQRSEVTYQPATGHFPPRKVHSTGSRYELHHVWWADSQ